MELTGLTLVEISHVVLHKIRLVHLDYYRNTMIASVSFVLTGNLICNFPQTGNF